MTEAKNVKTGEHTLSGRKLTSITHGISILSRWWEMQFKLTIVYQDEPFIYMKMPDLYRV